jgi:hypothetical protein
VYLHVDLSSDSSMTREQGLMIEPIGLDPDLTDYC